MNMRKVLFMATPYKLDPDHDKKKTIIRELLRSTQIDLLIANDTPEGRSMTVENTIEWMQTSDFFLVDLSYERPSCYYELGYIQSMNKDTLIVARSGEKIHMSLNRNQISFYDNIEDYEEMVRTWISKL